MAVLFWLLQLQCRHQCLLKKAPLTNTWLVLYAGRLQLKRMNSKSAAHVFIRYQAAAQDGERGCMELRSTRRQCYSDNATIPAEADAAAVSQISVVRQRWPHLGVTHVEVPTALQDVPNLLWSRCCTLPDVVLTMVRRTIQRKQSLCPVAHRDCHILLWHCSGCQLAPRQSGCAPRRRLSACCGSQEGTPDKT